MKVLRLWDRSPQGWAREAGVEETPGSSCQKSCAVQPRLEEQHPPLFPIWDQLGEGRYSRGWGGLGVGGAGSCGALGYSSFDPLDPIYITHPQEIQAHHQGTWASLMGGKRLRPLA